MKKTRPISKITDKKTNTLEMRSWVKWSNSLIGALKVFWGSGRGSAAEHVLYFKCHRKYYIGSASENTNLVIFCDTCL